MSPPYDPFERTAPDSPTSYSHSPASVSHTPSALSTLGGQLVSGVAIWQIGGAWGDGRIPVSWHALLAIVVVAVPSAAEQVASLARGAIRAWARRGK